MFKDFLFPTSYTSIDLSSLDDIFWWLHHFDYSHWFDVVWSILFSCVHYPHCISHSLWSFSSLTLMLPAASASCLFIKSISASSVITVPSKLTLVCSVTIFYNQFNFKLNVDGSRYKLWRQTFSNMYRCYSFKISFIIRRKAPIRS